MNLSPLDLAFVCPWILCHHYDFDVAVFLFFDWLYPCNC